MKASLCCSGWCTFVPPGAQTFAQGRIYFLLNIWTRIFPGNWKDKRAGFCTQTQQIQRVFVFMACLEPDAGKSNTLWFSLRQKCVERERLTAAYWRHTLGSHCHHHHANTRERALATAVGHRNATLLKGTLAVATKNKYVWVWHRRLEKSLSCLETTEFLLFTKKGKHTNNYYSFNIGTVQFSVKGKCKKKIKKKSDKEDKGVGLLNTEVT